MIREYCSIALLALIFAGLAVAATVDNLKAQGYTTIFDHKAVSR